MLIDTHCHLTHERFREDLPDVLCGAAEAGVGAIIAIASDLEDAREVRELWRRDVGANGEADQKRPELYGTAGVHPHSASAEPVGLLGGLIEAVETDPRVVAIGECGLDYHYDFSPREAQRRVFDVHVEAAERTGLPLVVHCREAEEDMMEVVRSAGEVGVRGVLHCFPGDLDLLSVALDSDWLVSFTGLVTFKSFDGEEAVRRVPSDRYMIETDGPYMAPVPFRGRRSEPAMVRQVRDRVAELRGVDAETVERQSTSNARAFFGLQEAGD